jgi:hypothetical protein
MLPKNTRSSIFSIKKTLVGENGRLHDIKVGNSNVYLARYNGRPDFGRFHVEKSKALGVYTTTSFNTRLNA